MTHLLVLVLACEEVADGDDVDYDALHAAFKSIAIVLMAFLGLLCAVRIAEGLIFDVPTGQSDAPLQFSRKKGLRIDNLSDTAALKMTRFNWSQLHRLYAAFDLEGLLELIQEKLSFPTGHAFYGTPCCYRIHPEEVLLFTLCRLATGMAQVRIVDTYLGGDKNRWTYVYPWMLKYLDERYANIIGHQGLARFGDDFPRFRGAIEMYVQHDHRRELVDGTMTIVPGLNFMPWDVFGFIDDTIDEILTPFSGPRGDYEGAARKSDYTDAQ
jgi:hypothetical protein